MVVGGDFGGWGWPWGEILGGGCGFWVRSGHLVAVSRGCAGSAVGDFGLCSVAGTRAGVIPREKRTKSTQVLLN